MLWCSKRSIFALIIEGLIVFISNTKNMKSPFGKFILAACLIVAAGFSGKFSYAYSQSKDSLFEKRFDAFSKLLSPEKLYIQTDKDFYCAGDTLWLKGYLVNNSYLADYPPSNFIYVELICYDQQKNVYTGKVGETPGIVQRVKVKRRSGVMQGYIVIPASANTGHAILRGYSYWNLNNQVDYIFCKDIQIVNPMKDDYVRQLVDKKVDDSNEYTKVGVKNPFKKEGVPPQDIDCQFFPESGRFLFGAESVIAFKAISENGLGDKVNGIIYNSDGNKVLSFSSNDLGFGKFNFTQNSPSEKYYAVISDSRGVNKKVKFPIAESTGVVINISFKDGDVISKVSCSPDINADSLRYLLNNGSELFYDEELAKVKNLSIPSSKLVPGINCVTIADAKGNVFATRQFFVFPMATSKVSLKLDKESYGARETGKCSISLADSEGNPLGGDFSVSITDDNLAPYAGAGNNIISYMLLSGELKGFIENPQSYFDIDKPVADRLENIDLLLLTQGWRYYDIPAILKGKYVMPQFGKEYIQTISGRVTGLSKKRKSTIVSFIAPSIKFSAMGQLDTTGFFELKDISFPDSTLFIVNAVGTNGRKSFIPYINEDSFAPMNNYFRRPNKITYSQDLGQDLMRKYYKSGGETVYQLDPIIVTSNRKYSAINNPSPLSNQMYKQGQLREGKELEPYKAYDLITYVYETCQGLRFETDTTTGERYLVCRVPHVSTQMSISSGWEEIIVFINGIAASSSRELEKFMVSDIESLVYLTGADAAPYAPMMDGSATVRSVVMIKTALNTRTGAPINVAKGYPLGWQKPRYFYSPSYETRGIISVPAGSDKRSTIYWNPILEILSNGSLSFFFDTSDGSSNYTIVIEGITANGEYVFKKQSINRHIIYR